MILYVNKALWGEKMVVSAILAGGKGSRMGSDLPKQFLETGGIPVIIRSINAFLSSSEVDNVIISVCADYYDYTKELVEQFVKTDKEIFIIQGGSTRSDTLFGIVSFMKEKNILDGSIVLTHDAVRPFINERIISENIEAAKKYGACNTCIPAVDTMLISDDGEFISSVPDRNHLFHAQTPQSFDAAKLYKLMSEMSEDVFNMLTDGCSVFTYSGEPVYLVRGESYNIKITFPDDIKRAESIIKEYYN